MSHTIELDKVLYDAVKDINCDIEVIFRNFDKIRGDLNKVFERIYPIPNTIELRLNKLEEEVNLLKNKHSTID